MNEQEPIALVKPDLIHIQVSHTEEVFADKADLYVNIKGSSLVTGAAALQKAHEVRQLVAELTQHGVVEKDIHLESVHAKVVSGFLGKSSAATYKLKIRCTNLSSLADILGIITAQKNTELRYIIWVYQVDDEEESSDLREEWLAGCIRRANAKAAKIAEGLGVKLKGIHHFVDHYMDLEVPPYDPYSRAPARLDMAMAQVAMTHEDLGLNVTHSKKVGVSVEVEYRISEYEPK